MSECVCVCVCMLVCFYSQLLMDTHRYHASMRTALRGVSVQTLFLDTTYCDPKYRFPPQETVIAAMVDAARPHVFSGDTLVCIGAYTIGKERLSLALAAACGVRVYVDEDRYATYSCLDLPNFDKVFTTDPTLTNVWVVSMSMCSMVGAGKLLHTVRGRVSVCDDGGAVVEEERAMNVCVGGGDGDGNGVGGDGGKEGAMNVCVGGGDN